MPTFPSRLGTHAKYLGRMLQCCGVDPAHLAHDRLGLSFLTIARACMACGHTESCRQWLESHAPDGSHEPPSFCPNAERFRQARAG